VNLFPRLSISASVASQRTQASDLVDGLNVWSVGANLMQPIFHGGELRAQKRSAVAAYEASAAAYEQTVLQALQQVADSMRALEADALTLQARSTAAAQATASYDIVQRRHAVGGVSQFSLLDAQRQQLQTSLDRSRAQADRYADTVALFQALGGGW
jgi:outer membrane protein TolC